MKNRIVGLETEYALIHYPKYPSRQKTLAGTEVFELMNRVMDTAGIVRLYEEKFYPETRTEPFSNFEDRRRYTMKKNRMFLENGARFYLDTGDHPEYATPECRSAADILVYDKAGERLIEELSRRTENRLAAEGSPCDIFVCKNNVDVRGNTYGCHENYLIPRRGKRHNESAFFKKVIRELIPFLITRQIFCGSGKVMTGNKLGYQISQRADFIDSELSSDTTFRRGIINSRDEPLSRIDKYRRLHILVGDSNLSEMATFLKVGTTMLVLRLIEEEGLEDGPVIEDPILSLREISHDPDCMIKLKLADGSYRSAMEIQRYYFEKVRTFLETEGTARERETALTLSHWKRMLDTIERDPSALGGELDWVAKRQLTDRYLERAGSSYQELNRWVYFIKRMKSLRLEDSLFYHHRREAEFDIPTFLKNRMSQGDFMELKRHVRYSEIAFEHYFRIHGIYHNLLKMDIKFHDIRRDRGLYYRMREKNLTKAFDYPGLEEAVNKAQTQPPRNTRARIRGEFIKLLDKTKLKGAVNWDSISLHDVKLRKINLMSPFHSSSKTVDELFRELGALASLGGKT
jgi:hypothetical protein